jgi:hypothetical protein
MAKKLTPEQALAQIQKLVGEGKVHIATDDHINQYAREVQRVLDAVADELGNDHVRAAFVSDLSAPSDFGLDEAGYQRVSERLGVSMTKGRDRLWEIAKRLAGVPRG